MFPEYALHDVECCIIDVSDVLAYIRKATPEEMREIMKAATDRVAEIVNEAPLGEVIYVDD